MADRRPRAHSVRDRPVRDRSATRREVSGLVLRTVDELSIQDERAFRHVPLYAALKELLRRDGYTFQVLPRTSARWNRALLLNLTYWHRDGGDVLESDRVPADVIAHAALHLLAAHVVGDAGRTEPARRARRIEPKPRTRRTLAPTSEALFFGESIASAFDVYLVGRMLSAAPRSAFLATQVPAMAEVAREAGLPEKRFGALLETMAQDPEASFESLRELLYETSVALVVARDAGAAHDVLARAAAHPFGALLHRYELSNWVLYARAYAGPDPAIARKIRTFDADLRRAESPLAWLSSALLRAGSGPGEHGV